MNSAELSHFIRLRSKNTARGILKLDTFRIDQEGGEQIMCNHSTTRIHFRQRPAAPDQRREMWGQNKQMTSDQFECSTLDYRPAHFLWRSQSHLSDFWSLLLVTAERHFRIIPAALPASILNLWSSIAREYPRQVVMNSATGYTFSLTISSKWEDFPN